MEIQGKSGTKHATIDKRVSIWQKAILIPLIAILCAASPSVRFFGTEETNDSVTIGGGKFFTDGPVRYDPAVWDGKTYVGSDDGHLYCFDENGKLLWKFFGGYSNRKMIMVGRLVSAWHVSGGPADDLNFYYGNHRKLGQPQVTGGRMFIEGPEIINAFDVYTGRHLWQWQPEGSEEWSVDHPSPTSKERIPFLAGRMASSEDILYAVSDRTLYALDAATGKPLSDFRYEVKDDWGSVNYPA